MYIVPAEGIANANANANADDGIWDLDHGIPPTETRQIIPV